MKALIVKDDGLIYAAEVPEEPRCGGKPYCCEGRPCDALHSGYIQAFTFAIESAVLCADQEKAKELVIRKGSISRDKDGFYQPIVGVHPIPDLQWEVKEELIYAANPPEFTPRDLYKQVAILKESTPSTEQESQEELWDEAQLRVKDNLGTYSNDLVCDLARWAIEAMKKHYNITRKPAQKA